LLGAELGSAEAADFSGPVAGVVYEHEFVSELPVEPHDANVNYVVTESAILALPLTR
jgi:5-formyltetrahydrofolate cyclo-ligase